MIAAALLSPRDVRAKTPEPPLPEAPLPGEEGPVSSDEAFSLLPSPDAVPPEGTPPIEENPVVPPPEAATMDQLPDIEPLGMPSDGEPMPELPPVPGLVLPTQPKPRTIAPGDNPNPVEPGTASDLLPPPSIELAKSVLWHRSPLEARKASIKQRKPLLLFFAQMWDGSPTVQLNNDLLAMPEFKEFAAANLILTKLQFPVGSPGRGYTEAKLEALKRFKDYFKVKGFPTIVVIDEDGRELKRIKGYVRVKDLQNGQEFSTAHSLLDQLKDTLHRYDERRQYQQKRIDNLISQGYRLWKSRAGSTMMGKLVEAKPERIILADETGHWRQVHPSQLILFDAEWARRKQAGLIPDKPAAEETAIAAAPPPPTPPASPAAAKAAASPLPRVVSPGYRPGILGGTRVAP